ncbi:MAG: class I SAM-dependent methyltransferase [Candidatus Woesearchaeota archaeon]|jgi:ubiquinone/menaquinone biosynthesis C-methylase UbiE
MGNYNRFAEEYARQTEEIEQETRKHFYSLIPNSLESKLLLDVGCGSGHDAEYYTRRGAKVSGIDLSKREIEMANRRGCGIFVVGSMDDLPYNSNSFDIVTSVYALQASNDVPKALGEMVRVAKPGAAILIVTKHPFRNLIEGHVNDQNSDYYAKREVTSRIFNQTITLSEPGHTMMEYFHPSILSKATLELFEEHTDFPASEQVILGMKYPTFMILKFLKKSLFNNPAKAKGYLFDLP